MSPLRREQLAGPIMLRSILFYTLIMVSLAGGYWAHNTVAAPLPPAQAAPADTNPNHPANARRLPDPVLTPGDTLPVTASDICVSGYAHKIRNVPADVRASVWARYGYKPISGRDWEVDHLISLELGGSNSIKNLWPQPGWGVANYHDKDKLENRLHADVCTNQMPLAQAQKAISANWETAYAQYMEDK